jgi:pyruvate formate lyase activating enzyme
LERILNLKLIDYLAIDVKAPLDDDAYYFATQSKALHLASRIERSILSAVHAPVEFEARTTVVPTLITEQSVIEIAMNLKQLGVQQYVLQQFRPDRTLDPKYRKVRPYSKKEMQQFCAEVQKYIPNTIVRGLIE